MVTKTGVKKNPNSVTRAYGEHGDSDGLAHFAAGAGTVTSGTRP